MFWKPDEQQMTERDIILYPSSDISTHPKCILSVQMMGSQLHKTIDRGSVTVDTNLAHPRETSPSSWMKRPCAPGDRPSMVPSITQVSGSTCTNRITPRAVSPRIMETAAPRLCGPFSEHISRDSVKPTSKMTNLWKVLHCHTGQFPHVFEQDKCHDNNYKKYCSYLQDLDGLNAPK